MDTTNGPNDFTVHQLKIFRTVAHHQSYTKAAEVLYLSQPAISQQIRTVERVLGRRIFACRGRGIVLSSAGQEFLPHAERLLTMLAEFVPVVKEIHALGRGSVLVGASTSAATYVVLPLLGAFHALYPRIHVTLMVDDHHSVEESLVTRQVDLAVMSLVEGQDRFDVQNLIPHTLVLLASPPPRLAGYAALKLHALTQETFLQLQQ